MGLATAAIVALGAGAAGMQIAQGYSAAKEVNRQGEYNAQVYEQQAGTIGEQARIEAGQYDRAISRTVSKGIVRTAGAGLDMGGSPLAVMVDTETQMLMDKAVGQYDYEVKRRYTLSGADYYRQTAREQGKAAIFGGYSNAFSTMLNTTAVSGAFSPKMPTTPSGGKWDSVGSYGRVWRKF